MYGTIARLNAYDLVAALPGSEFETSESWVNTANDGTGTQFWVEEGLMDGTCTVCGGMGELSTDWFWADKRAGGGFHAHYVGAANLNTWYTAKIVWAGNSTWNVFKDGQQVGPSTSNGCCSYVVDAGIEATDDAAVGLMEGQGLQVEAPIGTWTPTWSPNAGINNSPTSPPPTSTAWVTYGQDFFASMNDGGGGGCIRVWRAGSVKPGAVGC